MDLRVALPRAGGSVTHVPRHGLRAARAGDPVAGSRCAACAPALSFMATCPARPQRAMGSLSSVVRAMVL